MHRSGAETAFRETRSRPRAHAARAITAAERRRLLFRVRFVIERHYGRPLTVPAVAKALATSPRQVQRAYETFSTSTFRVDLLAQRMSVAAELLSEPSIPVGDVARLVGYRQPSHFAKAFRRRFGCTPSAYRRRAVEQSRQESAHAGR